MTTALVALEEPLPANVNPAANSYVKHEMRTQRARLRRLAALTEIVEGIRKSAARGVGAPRTA
jgi:hypothetical protein